MAGSRSWPQGSDGDGVGARQWPPTASGGGGGSVTPGAGSSGFTDPRVLVSMGGAIDEGPTGVYEYAVDAGNDLLVRHNMELGGLGAILTYYVVPPTTAGQRGFDASFVASAGAAGSGATAGGAAGDVYLSGSTGGAGTALAAAGAGGHAIVAAGAAGANGGGGGANGGSVYLDAADGTGAGVAGSVLIATQTTGSYGSRYVQAGPDAGSIPLLVDRSAPVGAELLNVRHDTDALCLLGRAAIGSWVATDELCLAHYDYRASATGYTLRANAAGTSTVINVPAAGNLYMLCAGSTSLGWRIDFTTGAAHFLPGADNAHDIGSASARARDIYTSRDVYVGDDVEFLKSVDHDCGVAAGTSGAGSIGGALSIYAGNGSAASGATHGNDGGALTISAGDGGQGTTGLRSGAGGALYLYGGDAGATPGSLNAAGGGVTIRGGTGVASSGSASGGSVTIDGGTGSSETRVGDVLIGTVNPGIVKICANDTDSKLGFHGATPVAQQTGVAVTAAAIHAALVNLGLITA